MSGLKYGVNTVAMEEVIAEFKTWNAEQHRIAGKAWDAARDAALYAVLRASLANAHSPAQRSAWGMRGGMRFCALWCVILSPKSTKNC